MVGSLQDNPTTSHAFESLTRCISVDQRGDERMLPRSMTHRITFLPFPHFKLSPCKSNEAPCFQQIRACPLLYISSSSPSQFGQAPRRGSRELRFRGMSWMVRSSISPTSAALEPGEVWLHNKSIFVSISLSSFLSESCMNETHFPIHFGTKNSTRERPGQSERARITSRTLSRSEIVVPSCPHCSVKRLTWMRSLPSAISAFSSCGLISLSSFAVSPLTFDKRSVLSRKGSCCSANSA